MRLSARWPAIVLLTAALAACDSAEERAAGHFEKAMELLKAGEPARANVEFRNVLQLQPQNVEARYRIAEFQQSRNNLRGAVGQLRSVIELAPRHVPARRDLAEILLVADDAEEASRHIEVAFAEAPEDVEIRAIKAAADYRVAVREGTERGEAVAMARDVLEEDPASTTARLVLAAQALDEGAVERALAEVDAGIERDPENLSLNVVRLGVLERMEDLQGVGAQLERLVELYPDAARFRESLARWYMSQSRHDDAEAQYRALAAAAPDDRERALDVVRFLNVVRGEDAAREELERLAGLPDASAEFGLALAALDARAGDDAAAATRLESLMEAHGTTADGQRARVERAKIHLRNDELEAADALIKEVLDADPENEAALLLRAGRHLAADDPEAAIEDLRSALDVAPENVRITLLLATAYERNGNATLAQERLAEAVQLSEYEPGIALRYVRLLVADEKLQVAESVLRQAMVERGPTRQLLLALGQLKLRQQDWREAEGVAGRLRALDPEDQAANRLEAAALLGQRRGEEGAEMLESLLESDAENPSNLVSFVRALIAAGDMDRAASFLETRLAENPDDVTSLLLTASIDAATGALDEAETRLKRVIELEPDNSAAYAALARIYNSQGRSDLVGETLSGGLERSDDPALRLTKAMQLEFEQRFEEALEIYEDLYRENPDSVVVANNFASLLSDHRGDDPAAVERAYNIAKRFRNANQPHMQDTYGWLLHLTGDSDGALPVLERAAAGLPTNPVVQYHYGVVLLANERLAQARDRLERALELGRQVPFGRADRAEAAIARIEELEARREAAE